MSTRILLSLCSLTVLLLAPTALSQGVASQAPEPWPLDLVDQVSTTPLDLATLSREDLDRERDGLPPRYAVPFPVSIDPARAGTWEPAGSESLMWRLRIRTPGAVSVNLGFGEYSLPPSGRLLVYAADSTRAIGPFTAADNESHGELWTPILFADDVVVELTLLEDELDDLKLRLTQIGHGYRGFGGKVSAGYTSGSCNVDVVCSQGDAWRNEIPSVGVISTGGSTFCTGFMVNNVRADLTPYFMTALHCGIGSGNAASLVVYWNYETSVCGGSPDGVLNEFNTGSFWRAGYSPSDFTLVELDDPANPASNVTFSGWNATGADATSAIAIHHPNTDEKRISFENDPTTTTSYLGNPVPGDGTHVRVTDWDLGTTEPGSSGSPLYDQNHRVIGQLHGGFASCSSQTSDWYGKFSVSWTGGGSSSSRLSDWLDPDGTGTLVVGTIGNGLSVIPGGQVLHAGPVGGPFTNPSVVYTLENLTTSSLNYQVSLTSSFGVLLDGGTGPVSGTLAAGGGTTQVTVSLGAAIDSLPVGLYVEDVQFADLTNATAQSRSHSVEVGRAMAYDFTMDTDPGWTMQSQWSHGSPTGGGGQFGNPDPTTGHTGSNVLGYNLAGDYPNNLSPQHMTTAALDCSSLTGTELRFWRWLNVEQPLYDHAVLAVSNNGTSYTTIWENTAEMAETSWSQQTYDISSIADGQSTVYVRWTMGSTDGSWQFSGWNVDDVEIWGFAASDITSYCTGKTSTQGCVPFVDTSGSGLPSVSDTGAFNVRGNDFTPGNGGILVYGFGKSNLNFHGGKLCVKSPIRTAGKAAKSVAAASCTSVTSTGRLINNFNNRIQGGQDPLLTVGQQVYAQWQQRDPGNTVGGFADTLSDGLRFTVGP